MVLNYSILISVWIVTIALVFFTTPRNKIRDAWVIFMFQQVITWVLGLVVAQYRLIEYPVRGFSYATRTSFSFEYFIYPAICIVFNLKFPVQGGLLRKVSWYLFFPSWMTVLEILLERYTELIRYIKWEWYWTWISLYVTFYCSRKFYLWFIKEQIGRRNAEG